MVAGALAEAAAWRLVASGRSVWRTMALTLGALGVLALLTGRPSLASHVSAPAAALGGLGSGAALYLATRAFLLVVRGWDALGGDSARLYGHAIGLSAASVLALSAVVVAGEEIFWRGLFQARLEVSWSAAWAAAVTWLTFVTANAFGANLAVLLGAAVGGAVWVGLAWWSGGLLASLACHAVWTGLMIAVPPVRR